MPITKRNVYSAGEAILDIIFRDNLPVSACPGGSALNSSISLARLGAKVTFLTEFGNDNPGGIIYDFLNRNKVNTSLVSRYTDGKTAVSLAFLDESSRNASYTFYRQYPSERMKIPLPGFTEQDILLFGSYYSIDPGTAPYIGALSSRAKEAGAILFYDPNFRKPHLEKLEEVRENIIRNLSLSQIVRGSDEDFSLILGTDTGQSTWNRLRMMRNLTLIYTSGPANVELFTPYFHKSYTVPRVEAISTIGAGDTFNAGIIFGLLQHEIVSSNLNAADRDIWDDIIVNAIKFSSAVCLSYENFLPENIATLFYADKNPGHNNNKE